MVLIMMSLMKIVPKIPSQSVFVMLQSQSSVRKNKKLCTKVDLVFINGTSFHEVQWNWT